MSCVMFYILYFMWLICFEDFLENHNVMTSITFPYFLYIFGFFFHFYPFLSWHTHFCIFFTFVLLSFLIFDVLWPLQLKWAMPVPYCTNVISCISFYDHIVKQPIRIDLVIKMSILYEAPKLRTTREKG